MSLDSCNISVGFTDGEVLNSSRLKEIVDKRVLYLTLP